MQKDLKEVLSLEILSYRNVLSAEKDALHKTVRRAISVK